MTPAELEAIAKRALNNRQMGHAYPVEVFTPLTKEEINHSSSLLSRASASMGRHLGGFLVAAADDTDTLLAYIDELRIALETEKMRTAMCEVAALGHIDECDLKFDSPALQAVFTLYREVKPLREANKP